MAIDHQAHQPSRRSLADDGNLGHDNDGVRAQRAVRRLDQVNALVADGNLDRLALPRLVRAGSPLPDRDNLLLIEHRDLRVVLDLRALLLWLLGLTQPPQANLVAVLDGELRPHEVTNPRPDAVLPGMKFLQPGMRLFRQRRSSPAEAVQLLQLAEKLDGIVDAINAEFELLDVVAVDRDFRLLARHVGLLAAQGKVGLTGVVLGVCTHEAEPSRDSRAQS